MKKADRFRYAKVYGPSEAARFANTTAANVRRWLAGYAHPSGEMKPVFGQAKQEFRLSFMDLCEVAVVAAFRSEGVKLETLRRAHAYAAAAFEVEYPFAHLELKKHGGHILHEFEKTTGKEQGLVLDMQGQYTLPGFVKGRIVQFDFEPLDHLAYRWFLHGRDVPIVIDPRFGAGLPTIEGRNLRTDIILGRVKSGQTIESIAEDFELQEHEIKEVLKHAA